MSMKSKKGILSLISNAFSISYNSKTKYEEGEEGKTEVQCDCCEEENKHFEELPKFECIKILKLSPEIHWAVDWNNNGKYIVSGGSDYIVKIWDIEKGACIKEFEGHNGIIDSVKFSPNGKYIASASYDKSIKIWDVSSGECLKTLNENFYSESSLDWHSDGNRILFASDDKKT